ncbi:MAG: hypothetical protein IJR47_03115 [Clostridia bacterium]|nr:hypothetical protein [Clostridia bacterium]
MINKINKSVIICVAFAFIFVFSVFVHAEGADVVFRPTLDTYLNEQIDDSLNVLSSEIIAPILVGSEMTVEYEQSKTLNPVGLFPEKTTTASMLSKIERQNDSFIVIDLYTEESFEAVRYGGSNHLDTEPKTAEDTEVLNSFGNSWDRRAIVVYYDGKFYAASMHTMPHGNGTVKNNNFNGHICIHFSDSKTHCGNAVCPKHQSMILQSLDTNISSIPAVIDLYNQ